MCLTLFRLCIDSIINTMSKFNDDARPDFVTVSRDRYGSGIRVDLLKDTLVSVMRSFIAREKKKTRGKRTRTTDLIMSDLRVSRRYSAQSATNA